MQHISLFSGHILNFGVLTSMVSSISIYVQYGHELVENKAVISFLHPSLNVDDTFVIFDKVQTENLHDH